MRFLSINPEDVKDALTWWSERKALYLHLSHMALDYLSIPGKYYLTIFIHNQITIVLQQHPLTSNTYSAVDDSFYHMFIAVSLHNQFVQFSASVPGEG
jgi:hypothetical protein